MSSPACPKCGETRLHPETRKYMIQGQTVTYTWFACVHWDPLADQSGYSFKRYSARPQITR